MLSDTHEYAFVWAGQDNGRPWGTKAQGYGHSPHLQLNPVGIDLTGIDLTSATGSGTETFAVTTTLVAGQWIGAQLRLGTTAAPLGGYGTVVTNTTTTLTVTWTGTVVVGGTVANGYLVRDNGLWASYPTVRVLTPYQPEAPVAPSGGIVFPGVPIPIVLPGGFTPPATITTFSDLGLFLPLSFLEGIASQGISEGTDSYTVPDAHPPSTADASSFTLSSGAVVVDAFAGGFIRVEDTVDETISWARILSNTALVFTLDASGWQGFGLPNVANVASWEFECWIPHYDNSPHHYEPQQGFRYPNNDMMPASEGDGRIHNLPRAITTKTYGDRFGSMLEFGYRMAAALGKRVNMIHLSVNDAPLIPRKEENLSGFHRLLGWWDNSIHGDWSLETTNGLAARLDTMITTMAPAALTAEGSTRTLRILGIVLPHGDYDATTVGGRESYGRTLREFVFWLRQVIKDAELSPYDANTDIPVVHPRLSATPFETSSFDEDKLINGAIDEVMAADVLGGTIDTDDADKISGDDEHFDGVGEAKNGEAIAVAMEPLVRRALAHGSTALEVADTGEVDICNLALSHIGQLANVTSLAGTSREAVLCAQFYPEARDSLLQMRAWGFALRREALVAATAVPAQYQFAYVVPPEALIVLAVQPPESTGDYSQNFNPIRFDEINVAAAVGQYIPQDFAMEQALEGHRVIYTDQDEAMLRYVARVIETKRYPYLFRMALSWHLASMLAGPIIKGEEGAQQARRAAQMMSSYLSAAGGSDANQRQQHPTPVVSWLAKR